MIAFHGDAAIKERFLAPLLSHCETAEIFAEYGEDHITCPMRLTLQRESAKPLYRFYETDLGIPEVLAHVEHEVYLGLHGTARAKFPYEFLNAIPVGAELTAVSHQLASWLLRNAMHGCKDAIVAKACRRAIQLNDKAARGGKVTAEDWREEAGEGPERGNLDYGRYYTVRPHLPEALAMAIHGLAPDGGEHEYYARVAEHLLGLLRTAPTRNKVKTKVKT